MPQNDQEFMQILNIIRRGQKLVLQAKKEGAETQMAEELINEAKYALKIDKREEAIDYAKKCIVEVIRAKREIDTENLTHEGALEKLTKEELRQKCKELGLESLGLKSDLVERIKERLLEMKGTQPPINEEKVLEEALLPKPESEEPKQTVQVKAVPPPPANGEVTSGVEALTKNAWNPKKAAKELTPGLSYLIEEKRPERLFHIYKALKEMGMDGIVISRTNSKILARTYGVNEQETVWLTGKEIEGEIRSVLPILEFIMSIYEEFMDNTSNGVILLDGLEYLLTNNKFNSVLRFIRQLVDNISQTECILMVALSPDALDSTEVTLLEKDLLPLNYIE